MTKGYFIREGDKTTCGGVVQNGDTRVIMYGTPHSREGDAVTCGKDGKIYEISGGISYIISHGRHVAGSLESFSTCPCRAQLIPSQGCASYEGRTGAVSQVRHDYKTKPHGDDLRSAVLPSSGSRYACSFVITSSETAQPLPRRKFLAKVDGIDMSGVTDAWGVAHIQAPSANSTISLHAVFSSPARTLDELSEDAQ